jgi:hypothetical protein
MGRREDDDTLKDFARWRLAKAQQGESCRWECVDGRWVSLTLDAEAGVVIVADSRGRSERIASYEGALELAKRWRT